MRTVTEEEQKALLDKLGYLEALIAKLQTENLQLKARLQQAGIQIDSTYID